MKYGFVVDNRKCIGCHACSVACKSENDVPLGVDRTWVKYTEQGAYPHVNRTFQVTRCNHCDNPPCVTICPVSAMYQREDGIVEFDNQHCIGCKACLQACPYDAIYMDPETNTAAKCHYCAHRIDVGLEPACVVVCPEHAILSGDMEDPKSEIHQALGKHGTTVRKPEQGTLPKLHYIDGDDAAQSTMNPQQLMFTDKKKGASRPPQPKPDQKRTQVAAQMVQVGYNAQHQTHWGWQVPGYILTKDIATGIMAMIPLFFGWRQPPQGLMWHGAISLLMLGLTAALLIGDLKQPKRFYYLLVRPQWKSWLTRGTFLILGFSLMVSASLLIGLVDFLPSWKNSLATWLYPVLMIFTFPTAILTSIYTAFLLGQAEGRDLWQHSLLPVQFAIRSLLCGSIVLCLSHEIGIPVGADFAHFAKELFGILLGINLAIIILAEFAMKHASHIAAQAADDIIKGSFAKLFWFGGMVCGHLFPLILLLFSSSSLGVIASGVMALSGIFILEYIFILAPQKIPNS